MSTGYAWEKLYAAVYTLVGSEQIKDRLEGAFVGALIRLTPDDLPNEDTRRQFVGIQRALTKVEARVSSEGSVAATIREMDEEKAVRVAREILGLFAEVADHYDMDSAGPRISGAD